MSLCGVFWMYLQTVDDFPTPFSLSGIIITMLVSTGWKFVGHFILRKWRCMSKDWEFLGTGVVTTLDIGLGLTLYFCFVASLNGIIMASNSEGLMSAIVLHFLVEKTDTIVHYMLVLRQGPGRVSCEELRCPCVEFFGCTCRPWMISRRHSPFRGS